jgi:hypothetical protein
MDPRWTFFSVDLEITNQCDRHCRMCPRERISRPIGRMSAATWREVQSAFEEIPPARIALSGMGNPFCHPNWAQFLRDLKARKLISGLVVPVGSLSPARIGELADVVPDFLEISFPSLREEVLLHLCPDASLKQGLEHVKLLHQALSGKTAVVLIGMKTSLNPDEEASFQGFWSDRGLTSRFLPCHSRGGNYQGTPVIARPLASSQPCGLFSVHSFITWEGKLLACCHDLTGETTMGSLQAGTMTSLATRKTAIVSMPPMPFSLCRNCDEFRQGFPVPQERPFPQSGGARRRFFRWWQPPRS